MILIPAPAFALSWLGRQGTRAVAAVIFIAIAIPPMGDILRPFLTFSIFALLTVAFMRVDLQRVRARMRQPRLILLAAGWSMAATVTELDTATLAVQGPRAEAVMADLGLGWISDMEDLERRSAQIDGIEVLVSRSGWSKQGGVELFLDDVDHAEQLWRAVEAAGRPHGIGPGAPNQSERIENVLLSYGTDTGFDANPLELGLEDHLDLDGPDFIGRDALRRVRSDGPQRQLLGALVSGERINRFGHPTTVRIAGDDVGQLSAAAWSPKYSTNLGLALVAAEVAVGSSARTSTPDGERTLTLVELPFADELPEPG